MSKKQLVPCKRLRRPKAAIEPIHLEELLAGAGMSGFLGVLEATDPSPQLSEKALARRGAGVSAPAPPVSVDDAASELASRVDSVVLKLEGLATLLDGKYSNPNARR